MSDATQTSQAKVERLVSHILEEYGMLDPDELDKLVVATAKRFLDDPPTSSKSMTEEEVRTKFGDMFDTAYELLNNNDKHDLIMMELETYAKSEGRFKELLQEIKDLHGEECEHAQLYAYVTIDVILPIVHESAAEMTGVLERIHAVLTGTKLDNYRARSGIEVNDVGKFL